MAPCRFCPAAGLQLRSPADGRVRLLPPTIPAHCSGGGMLQGQFPSPPLPCLLCSSVVALAIPRTNSKKRWCVLLSFGDEDISPHRSQQCRSLSVPSLPWSPFMGLLLSQASPAPGTSLCRSGREAQEGQRCLTVTLSHGHICGPPASHFPSPAAFGAESHSAPDPSVGQLEALSEWAGLVFPLGKRSGVQRARAPLGG